MSRHGQTLSYWVALVLCALIGFSAPAMAAKCPPDMVLVDEDENYVYCKDRHEHAKCIGEAGVALDKALDSCVEKGQHCLAEKAPPLQASVRSCLFSCMRVTSIDGCLANCGNTVILGADLIKPCDDSLGSCREKALADDKKRKEVCKR